MPNQILTVKAKINASIERVWYLWTEPKHVVHWNNATENWHTTKAESDFKVGGKFSYTMAAKDGSSQFDFEGMFEEIVRHKQISFIIADGRKVIINFFASENVTEIIESFEPENTNSLEMQQAGWQSILDNFKRYTESFSKLERLQFEIVIDAKVEKVYSIMLDEKQYMEWTSVFNSSSHYKGSFKKGSEILFLGESKEGKTEGMIGLIKENIPNEYVSIESIGIVMNGKQIKSGPELEGWIGAFENYSYQEHNGKTILKVELDTNKQFKEYFLETYPKALEKLKSICENHR
ncbi:MAG: SRPBCC domain-containing protein [Bacteroidota bacterium]